MEEWREIEAKGITWLVSNTGKIRTQPHSSTYMRTRNGVTHSSVISTKAREVAQCVTRNGYFEVATTRGGKRTKMLAHRLIGMAFIPGYSPELTINHINGNKLDNRLENLEWVSVARNTEHQWEIGLVNLRGENAPGSKLTTKRVVYIRRLLHDGVSPYALSIVAGVSLRLICLIRDGARWAHVIDEDEAG